MIFVEFESSNYPSPGAKLYFVGKTIEDVMRDTKNGTESGFAKLTNHTTITEARARELNLGFLDDGIESIQKGTSVSYMLRNPKWGQHRVAQT